jgi:hypothetical protein
MTTADGRYAIGPAATGSRTARARSGALAETVAVVEPRPAGSSSPDVRLKTASRSSR